ncbi:MAG: SH3 domain-containing protein [Lachnospiraceae bacterium]|nr:SH3 domain-containing protein [Lachnospiraceae bacterium]
MLARKKSIILCFVIGALLCTLISCGDPDRASAGNAMTVASAEGPPEGEAEVQDIRKTSLEENTREIVKATIKSTESDSQQSGEASESREAQTEAMAARIAGASVKGGAADYGMALQSEQAVQTESEQGGEPVPETEAEKTIAPELENKVVTTVVDTYLNIRLEPSEDSEIVGRLYEGSAGEVLETAEGWTRISSGGVEGWVHNEYVVSGEDAQSFAEESLRQVATVIEEGVRVRAGASLDSPWVGMVDLNETYRVVPEEPSGEVKTEASETESQPEAESVETPVPQETLTEPETQESVPVPESSEAESAESEMPVALEAPVGAEALIVPETGGESPDQPEQSTEGQPEEEQSAEMQAVETEAAAELKWIRIVYDGDKEGYVCADYVTTSFVLGKAKSMEEIREEEAAAARAEAEREAARKAERAKAASAEDVSAGSGWVSLGEFKITAYCGGACCNGQWAGTTASGAVPTQGRTIAVAPGLIPYGTRVKIAGLNGVFVAEDTGGFANSNPRQIDIYYADHGSATSRGVSYREIWVQR